MQESIDRRALVKGAVLAAGVSAVLGCGPRLGRASEPDGAAAVMKPGTYTGSAYGHSPVWKLPVSATVNETSILSIELPRRREDHGETESILESVREDLLPRIVEGQSLALDVTTGATESSVAVFAAVREALGKAFEAAGFEEGCADAFWDAPQPKAAPEPAQLDVDVLVVGLGAGGIMAMKSACEAIQAINPPVAGGGRVSILGIDRAGRFGGKSSLTHADCCVNPMAYADVANGGRPFCDAEAFKANWLDFLTTDGQMTGKPEVLDLFFAESGKTVDWLYDRGFRFGSMGMPNEVTGGQVEFNVLYTTVVDQGAMEDRRTAAMAYYRALLDAVVAQGGEYLLNTEGYELLMEDGRVVGVRARDLHTGQELEIRAKAVIMDTGGFGANQELLDTWLGERWRGKRKVLGTGQDTGAMLKAAVDAGAGTFNIEMMPMSQCCGVDHLLTAYPYEFYDYTDLNGRQAHWSLNNVPNGCGCTCDSLAVDQTGVRFLNEASYDSWLTDAEHDPSPHQTSGNCHWRIVSDEVLANIAANGFTNVMAWDFYCCEGDIPRGMAVPEVYEAMDLAVEEGLAFKGESVSELAAQIGMDPVRLTETVEAYNDACAAGFDDEFGKDPKFLTALLTPPFYAIQMFATAFGTNAALDVDDQIRVLANDHATPIEGLYACGLDSMGVLLNPNRAYPSYGGVAQGWSWTSGRLAGANAVAYIAEAYGSLTEVPLTQTSPGPM